MLIAAPVNSVFSRPETTPLRITATASTGLSGTSISASNAA